MALSNGLKRIAKPLLSSLLFCMLLCLTCYAGGFAGLYPQSARAPADAVIIEDGPVPLADGQSKVLVPSSPGKVVHSNSRASIDASNTAEGYIVVRYTGSASGVKLQITRSGAQTYTYDLNAHGRAEVFPLTSGNGTYTVNVFENVSGMQYALGFGANIAVELRSEMLPYLYPNQLVNFNAESATVKKSNELSQNAANQLAIVTNVYNYVVNNISYDTHKAQTVQSGYLPSVDAILQSKKGICFDYAAVMTAMLRAQRIPTRLEVGYVSNGAYHAWISTYINEVGWVNNVIQFDGKSWKLMDPTFASSANQSSNIMQYIGNGSNYQTAFRY